MNRLRVTVALCLGACAFVAGCVVDATEEPELEGVVAQPLDAGESPAPPGQGRDQLLAPKSPAAIKVEQAPAIERSDPDPEPWHGGKNGQSSGGSGNHD